MADHVIRNYSTGPTCTVCGWSSSAAGDAAVSAALAHVADAAAHRVTVEPVASAGAIRYRASCRCRWSDGWFHTRTEAARAGAEHQQVIAVARGSHITLGVDS